MFGLITYYFNKSHDSDNRSRMKCSFILQLNLQVTFNVFAKPILLFTLFPQILAKESGNTVFSAASFGVKPDNEIYTHEGSNVLLEWQFRVGSWSTLPTKVREFLFGVWGEPGYVKTKIVSVREHNSISIRSGYKRKVNWTGNIYDCVDCNATIRMYNLTAADFKTYGLEVDPQNLKKMPLKNWLTIVKFVPAKIIKWMRWALVEEGKATTVECKATGRPTPSVIIQRENHSLCNGTGHCLYKIPAANKSVHEGKYYCLVQQRNSSQIKRTLNLTVIPTRHMALNRTVVPARDIADGSHTAVPRTELVAAMTAGVIVFALTISLKILYHLGKIHRNKDQFETTKVEDDGDDDEDRYVGCV